MNQILNHSFQKFKNKKKTERVNQKKNKERTRRFLYTKKMKNKQRIS